MYRMLIVDDEEYITNSLYYFFKSQEHLELDIYKCYHADDAVKLLGRIKFNIVITDIHMPEKSGMELLAEVRRLWEDCRVIILSGHRQFEYAYEALQYNHVTYLLKTEGYDKLLSIVEQSLRDIEYESAREDDFYQLKGRLEGVMPILQRGLVERLLQRKVRKMSQQELDSVGSGMQARRPAALLLARIDDLDGGILPYDFERVNQVLTMEIDRCTEKKGILKLQTMFEKEIVLIFQSQDPAEGTGEADMLLYLREMLPAVQNICIQSGITLSFSLSADALPWESIPREYIRMKRMLNTAIGLNPGVILDSSARLQMSDGEEIQYVGAGDMQRLFSYLQAGKREHFLEEFDALTAVLRQNSDMNDEAARCCYLAAAFVMIEYIGQFCDKTRLKYDASVLLHPERLRSWDQGADMLLAAYFDMLELMEQSRVKNTNWAVDKVKAYVDENYRKDLSLVAIADHVHFNPSYLSRLFKEVTGTNLQDYIKEVRLRRAKELLEKGSLRVSQIAAETGFGTSKYFITAFKKVTGLTPAEWRESAFSQHPKIEA